MLFRKLGTFGSIRPQRFLWKSLDQFRWYSEDYYTDLSRNEWEPEPHFMNSVPLKENGQNYTLRELIRKDIDSARMLFAKVLQRQCSDEPGMWNKWGVMEWKSGDINLARRIFLKGSKLQFDISIRQSWATMELQENNYAEAKKLYDGILAADPNNLFALFGLTILNGKIGKVDVARNKFRELVDTFPDDVNLVQSWAIFEANQRNVSESRRLFTLASMYPECTDHVWHAWAKMEKDFGTLRNSQQIIRRGLSKFKKSKWLLLLSAEIDIKSGRFDSARDTFEQCLSDGYIRPAFMNLYAKMEEDLGNYNDAFALYERILEDFPTHEPSIVAFALLLNKVDGIEEARKVFEEGLAQVKDSSSLMHAWGTLESKEGNYLEAKRILDELVVLKPKPIQNWILLADVESRLGNSENAKNVLEGAMSVCEDQIPILIKLGELELKNGNPMNARAIYDRALRIDRTSGVVWNAKALLELREDPKRGQNIIQMALKVIPSDHYQSRCILFCTSGRLHASLEDFQKASEAFEKSFEMDMKNWNTHVIYADTVLIPNEANDEAKRHLELALRLAPQTKHKDIRHKLESLQLDSEREQ